MIFFRKGHSWPGCESVKAILFGKPRLSIEQLTQIAFFIPSGRRAFAVGIGAKLKNQEM